MNIIKNVSAHTDVAIIGAGFAGIGMGIKLKWDGKYSFRIFERETRIGGTWRDNTYPGIACDVPAHLYSFSFLPYPNWSGIYAPGSEVLSYLERCVEQTRLADHLLLDAGITDATWDEDKTLWRLTTTRGLYTASSVVLGCGRLTEPRLPDVPGVHDFDGDWFHTARWRHDVNLHEKRVAIIGSGASAVQIVPEVANLASELIVMQRSAPYVLPRNDSSYSAAERAMFSRAPSAMKSLRAHLFWKQEEMFAQRLSNGQAVKVARDRALKHLAAQVNDAKIIEQLTPDYELGCKRVLISNTYYPTFNSPRVHLQSTALAAIEGQTIIGKDGSRFDIDVIVYATGFLSEKQPYAEIVFGRNRRPLAEHWSGGMRGYASTTVHGFPNLFVINGPNSGLGHSSSIFMIETQINYVLNALEHRDSLPNATLEVSQAAEQSYVDAIDAQSEETVWINGGCSSWYVDSSSGRLTLLWPDFAHTFRAINGTFDPTPFTSKTVPVNDPSAVSSGSAS